MKIKIMQQYLPEHLDGITSNYKYTLLKEINDKNDIYKFINIGDRINGQAVLQKDYSIDTDTLVFVVQNSKIKYE